MSCFDYKRTRNVTVTACRSHSIFRELSLSLIHSSLSLVKSIILPKTTTNVSEKDIRYQKQCRQRRFRYQTCKYGLCR